MELPEFCARLDEELRTADYADVDASANGLQVGPDEGTVDVAAFAVDAAIETVERAVAADADVLVAHHGVVWGGLDRVTGRPFDRVAPLVRNDCALYVSHLPLDGHQRLGNAAGVGDVLGLDDRAPFGDHGGETIGQRGRLPEPAAVDDLAATLREALDTGDGTVQVLPFGSGPVEDVAIVTGSGADWLDEAVAAGADCLVTGEGKQQVYHEAREAGLDVVLAGHYATETFGVRSLQELAGEWGLETTYVDCPTGL
ncbi:MAG: Nif3-like dinuclear metal center hexameric protein [Haloarculaceae archaeon]